MRIDLRDYLVIKARSMINQPSVSVVIGAVGARGLAAVPLFEFLDEAAIRADLIIGSGGGAFVAAMRGAGFDRSRMREVAAQWRRERLFSQHDYRTLLSLAYKKLSRPGVTSAFRSPQRQQSFFRRVFGDSNLEELHTTTLLQTTDLMTGEAAVLDSGPVAEAVYAAGAFFPYFPPIHHQGRWLIDGAYSAAFPVMEAVKRFSDVIVVFFNEEQIRPEPEDLFAANHNLFATYRRWLGRSQTITAVDMHHHEIVFVPLALDRFIGPWESDALPELLEAGRMAVERKKDEILRAIEEFGAPDQSDQSRADQEDEEPDLKPPRIEVSAPVTKPESRERPTVAVVLGSGGIKALGAIPLFEFLDREGIQTDLHIGCSGGAIMCALRATDYSPSQMLDLIPQVLDRRLFSKIDFRALLGIPHLPFGKMDISSGVLNPDAIRAMYQKIFKDARMEELRAPLLLQTTDLQTGESHPLSSGPVADAVYASGAVYPILPPIRIDNRWLVDGAFASPCPVMEAVKRNIDVIIALTIEVRTHWKPTGCLETLNAVNNIGQAILTKSQMATAISLHHHEIVRINLVFDEPVMMWNLEKIPFVLEAGRKAVEAKTEKILAAIKGYACGDSSDHPRIEII